MRNWTKVVADNSLLTISRTVRMEEVHLTLSEAKSIFGAKEILLVGHMCVRYGRKSSPTKVNAIQNTQEKCTSV